MKFFSNTIKKYQNKTSQEMGGVLSSFLSEESVVGDLLSLDYNHAIVLVHDSLRQQVGGLPMGCFLLASRLNPKKTTNAEHEKTDAKHEDTALIFMRVVGHAPLANHSDTEKYRLEAGRRAIDTLENWDSKEKTDQFTLHELRHAGVRCSVLGTFRMKEYEKGSWELTFGADISNFYSGQGMKVYKPIEKSLERIVNYTKPTGVPHLLAGHLVHIGHVRYCSSETVRSKQTNVPVNLEPTDLLARRTALFGMSRSGKSNTIKTIASSVFKLREKDEKGRIGQLIFDVNGEYCNVNEQDAGCLRNVWRDTKETTENDVATYGLFTHPYDKKRQLLKINFMGNELNSWFNKDTVAVAMESLIAGKEIINESISAENAGFIKEFLNTSLQIPMDDWDGGVSIRYRRCITVYRSLLVSAGFEPQSAETNIKGLFSKELRKALESAYPQSAKTLGQETVLWAKLSGALEDLSKFFNTKEFKEFEQEYINGESKTNSNKHVKPWADDMLKGILALLRYPTGISKLRQVKEQHSPEITEDYSDKIVDDLRKGKLVIVDGSVGSESLIKHISERIMWSLFNAQKNDFVKPEFKEGEIVPPPDVIVYIEEAHNLLPKQNTDLGAIWPRVAKEGSKFHIGMVFSTQEPSSILSNILKNTDNWFVAHLNNEDEVKELKKYYDFGEFVNQILKVPDTGFLRMRCLSNPYIVPVQVNEFKASKAPTNEKKDTEKS